MSIRRHEAQGGFVDGHRPGRRFGSDASSDRAGSAGRWPHAVRWSVSGAVLATLIATVVARRDEVVRAVRLLADVDPLPLGAAAMCEALSLLCFAGVWRWLLTAGGARWPLRRAAALTLGANAVAGALPAGAVLATAWSYRQLRRRAVDADLAATVLAVAGALSLFSLGSLMGLALAASGSAGWAAGGWTMPLVLVALVASAAVAALVRRSKTARRCLRRLWGRGTRHVGWARELGVATGRVVDRAAHLGQEWWRWATPVLQSLGNWVFDLACLILCMHALHIAVAWPGALVAYVLTQIPAGLRLTPGNIGVVEAGLAVLLSAYGVPSSEALAAALLYRAVNYWAVQPIGWCCCAVMTLRGRRGPRGGRAHLRRGDQE
ncbi:lysylphosphatidylglycerol synthase transmembrane domain-containing protein [Streptomyces albidoflavus]|uniref:lysylphosphatidylglycerol synthase transmembrane domain-containing protein n=1 Tax=Streptomyces albidoflavus TaxID=1886 RepID=UPI0039FC9831